MIDYDAIIGRLPSHVVEKARAAPRGTYRRDHEFREAVEAAGVGVSHYALWRKIKAGAPLEDRPLLSAHEQASRIFRFEDSALVAEDAPPQEDGRAIGEITLGQVRGNVLVIGDLHAPFMHKGYLSHLQRVRDQYKCDLVVNIGDEIDNHAISYHESDPDGMSAGTELDRAIETLQPFYDAFPEQYILLGNHSALTMRQGRSAGLPQRMLRSPSEILMAPPAWRWCTSLEMQSVYYTHGTGIGGAERGAKSLSIMRGQSVVCGHFHTVGGVAWHSNGYRQLFAAQTGCGVDASSYAMAYARDFPKKPVLGCVAVTHGGRQAHFIPMPT